MSDITYVINKNIYINLTNRCSMNCTFCIRQNGPTMGNSNSLWLESEPDKEQVLSELEKYNEKDYESIVFCGYGEPLERADDVIWLAQKIKQRFLLPIRINTNGHGNFLAQRDIVPELAKVIDQISISLNAPTKDRYNSLCRPKFDTAYEQMLDFSKKCVENKMDVVMSVVDVISDEEEAACEKIAKDIGARFRAREKE